MQIRPSMKRIILSAAIVLAFVLAVKLYRSFYQLDYPYTFSPNTSHQSQAFTVRPTLNGDSEWFKIRLKGVVNGKIVVLILPYYSGNNDSLTVGFVDSLVLENKSDLDTILQFDYYGNQRKDKVVIQYQPVDIKRVDFTISAGVFGVPFYKLLAWLSNLTSSD